MPTCAIRTLFPEDTALMHALLDVFARVALCSKLGLREDVLHFDIPVPSRTPEA
jgi:hypothetical protein